MKLMVRRILWLGALLLVMLTSIPACSDTKPNNVQSTVPDPQGGAVPKPAGKGG
jgi:hypothetical protein